MDFVICCMWTKKKQLFKKLFITKKPAVDDCRLLLTIFLCVILSLLTTYTWNYGQAFIAIFTYRLYCKEVIVFGIG